METIGNFFERDRFYSSDEKKSLRSGDLALAMETCRGRHNERAVAQAFARTGDTRLKASGVPKVLDSLCVRLGISYPSGPNPAGEKGLRPRKRQREIVNYLASLPNAESYREQHWLDTPELWAFADLSDGKDSSGAVCSELKDEIRRKAASWCDRWVPYSLVSLVSMKGETGHIYLFPFADELKMILEQQMFSDINTCCKTELGMEEFRYTCGQSAGRAPKTGMKNMIQTCFKLSKGW